jgi:hypothetical protein
MLSRKRTLPDLGSAKSPINLGNGTCAYRRSGRWHYRSPETIRQSREKFVEATDGELISKLELRSYQVIWPAHECQDRPTLACPACEMDALRALKINDDPDEPLSFLSTKLRKIMGS